MKKKNLLTFIFVTIFAGVLSLSAEPVKATVQSVKGDVKFAMPGSIFFKKLATGTTLSSGSIIKTGAASEAVISVTPGAAMRVDENTTVAISDMEFEKVDGKVVKRAANIQLSEGTLSSLLDSKNPEATDFRVKTPQGTAAARGTFYGVSVVDGQTFVKVEEGKVGFQKNPDLDIE
jgi:hypothetical protein